MAGSIFLLAQAREMLGVAQVAQDFGLTELVERPAKGL